MVAATPLVEIAVGTERTSLVAPSAAWEAVATDAGYGFQGSSWVTLSSFLYLLDTFPGFL